MLYFLDDRLLRIQSFSVMFILMRDVNGKMISANYTYKSLLIAHVLVLQCSATNFPLPALRSGYDYIARHSIGQ